MKTKLFFGLLFFLVFLPIQQAQAHGSGTLQVVNAPAGDCLMSVWTAPSSLRANKPVHVVVSLANAASELPVLDADVQVIATHSESGEMVANMAATTQESANKLFYEAALAPLSEGSYTIEVQSNCLDTTGTAVFDLQIGASNWLLDLAVPLLAGCGLLAFLVVQFWRKKRGTAVPANSPLPKRRPVP